MRRIRNLQRTRAWALAALTSAIVFSTHSAAATSHSWTVRDTSSDGFPGVVYGNDQFLVLADGWSSDSSGNMIISKSSSDGQTWAAHAQQISARTNWLIAHGGPSSNQVFVSLPDRHPSALWSPDGRTWTSVSATSKSWAGVAYGTTSGDGTFVAVASNSVMFSIDLGRTWQDATGIPTGNWESVAYGNGRFVAVSYSGSSNKVMTSTDGVTWAVTRTNPASPSEDPAWKSVTFGNNRYVAIANVGNCNNNIAACTEAVMTSTDGTTWTRAVVPQAAQGGCWNDVAYGTIDGVGTFVAVGDCGSARVMTSTDGGSTWTANQSVSLGYWYSVAYGNGMFVAVAPGGTEKIMSLGTPTPPTTSSTTAAATTTTVTAQTSPTTTSVNNATPAATTTSAPVARVSPASLPQTGSSPTKTLSIAALVLTLGLVRSRRFRRRAIN